MSEKNIIVGCYVRVSTENQLENYSIEEQTERLKAYCKSMGWVNYYFYSDPGHSGGNTNRPGLKRLLKDIESGKINMVAVYKLDRLSRSQKDTLVLIEDEFLSKRVEFTSVLEKFDTSTPFGRATLGMLSVFAQLEKDQITERFTMGRIGRSKAGYYHGGPTAPTGYKYIDGFLVVDEFKAAQVKEVFDRFLSGYSINSIQAYMSEKYGGWKSHPLILNILRNSVYIGKVKFKGMEYDGVHESIISKETYDQTQELLTSKEREDEKTSAQKTPFRAGYILSSLLYCKRCKTKYSANHGYYKCYSRSKSDKKYITDSSCRNDNWKIEVLDQVVIDEIKKLKHNPECLDALFDKSDSAQRPGKEDISRKINELENQISRLLDLYQMDNAPFQQVSSRITSLQNEKNNLISVMENEPTKNVLKKSDFINKLESLDLVLDSGSTEKKRLFISYMIKSIEIDGADIEIHWRI